MGRRQKVTAFQGYGYQQQKAIAALVASGKTPAEALQLWQSATVDQNELAQAEIAGALNKNDNLPYTNYERPRLLEEGLPIPPDYVFLVSVAYMMKTRPQMLERLATKWLDTQARIIGSLAQAGAGNIITAYSHSFLIALMLEQQYFIRQRGADNLIASLNWLTGAQELVNVLQGFAVPEVLTFAATGIPISPGKASSSTSNITKTDIAQLAKALKP